MNDRTIAGRILFSQNAITNALNVPTIQSALANFGYDETKLGEGASLLETAQTLQDKQVKEYGEQFSATDELHLVKANANSLYLVHLKLARIALKDNRGLQESLMLNGRRKLSNSGWLHQAKTFYTNALSNPEIAQSLLPFGLTAEKLTEAQNLVLDVESKLATQLTEKGEAQQATANRDQALDDLMEWINDFKTVAKLALESDKQLLEVLGMIEES
ncbi:MAG: hypothetical protein NXI20_14715 [bacterium]|nr:hypothetical protein [bacterium]